MNGFARRRCGLAIVSLAAAAALITYLLALRLAMRPAAFTSGWVLAAMVVFLTAYNLRKKLTYPPLFSSAMWLQLHIWVGFVSVAVFAFHTSLRAPTGAFETALWWLYVLCVVSGVLGLALSRYAPARLTARGEEVIYERIPVLRRKVSERAEALVLEAVEQTGYTTLADFYHARLAAFFRQPANRTRHLVQSTRPVQQLIAELNAQHRYFSAAESKVADEMKDLIRQKDSLDYHHVMQGALKLWLFVHIPLAYALVMFAVVHVLLVHAFVGGGAS